MKKEELVERTTSVVGCDLFFFQKPREL